MQYFELNNDYKTYEDLNNLGKYFQMPFRDFKTTYVNVQQTPNPVEKIRFIC